MAPQPDRSVRIEVTVKASQPELLEGLDIWLRLGLISDIQVRRLSQVYLSCLLPESAVAVPKPEHSVTPVRDSSTPNDFDTPIRETPRQSPLSRMWQSLIDELSVRWLLFLGVFLVVVSSAVLAATQWQRFPAVGQYSVLWAYTLIFWFGSFWAGQQPSLQLTAQTLRLITLLLVPVNFWAMDSFGLWHQPWEWLVVAIATFTLTANAVLHPDMRSHPSRFTSDSLLLLLLSYLHWGWRLSGFPLIAVYIGMVGTAILLPRRLGREDRDRSRISPPNAFSTTTTPQQDAQPDSRIGSAIVLSALTVLLGRAIFIAQVPIAQLGLALGICGWLFARLAVPPETTSQPPSFKSKVWEWVGGCLILFGWLVSFTETVPWQATAVSGLGLLFFWSRLQRYSQRRDLLAMFTIGLQAHWLIWQLVPVPWQQAIVTFATQLTNSENAPETLLSLALFPYLVGIVSLTNWLYCETKSKLARFAERLAFCLGLALTLVSLTNPILRSLNLLLSTLTLGTVTYRWTPTRTGLVYLTHITGWLTLTSSIDWLFPNLSTTIWASILLVGMIGEWLYSIVPDSPFPIPHSPSLQRSAWHLGFVLSGLSYVILWHQAYPDGIIDTPVHQQSMLLWLLTPLTLTGVASLSDEPRRRQASGLSVVALGMSQALTLFIPGVRLISLSFATGLMLVNTRYWRSLTAAVITVGFALSFIGTALWDGIPGLPRLSAADWFVVAAIAILVLWLLRGGLLQRNGTLPALYAQACDRWAITLCSVELVMLTLHALIVYAPDESLIISSPSWKWLIAACLMIAANFYRLWQQPTNWRIYNISWAVELAVAEAVILSGGSTLELATANIILGLAVLFASDGWIAQQRRPIPLSSIEVVPLLYAVLGLGLRLSHFTSWTGLLTLGAGLTGIGVGRRQNELKPLTYLSVAGISFAWYELVIYQMLQAEGGSLADAFTILAGLASAIAVAYRLLGWFWQLRTDEPFFSLSIAEIKATAHIHWAIGSLLMIMAGRIVINSPEPSPHLTGIAIPLCLLLAAYALLQGRKNNDSNASDTWVYIGMTEMVATYVYARMNWTQLNLLDTWLAIIACGLAYAIYELPWESWGWNEMPWQRSSLVLPVFAVLATTTVISDPSLLLVAGFYAWIAIRGANIRWTYISVILIDWVVMNWFSDLKLKDLLWYITPFGISLLYVAQFDPALQQPEERQMRHFFRIIGSGFICGAALFLHLEHGIIPAFVGIIFIFAGLAMRVRAFLYVGTASFLISAFYQLVILIKEYPFVKWVVGIIIGIIFIAMAANFETRREQINSAFRNSRVQLKDWE